MSKLTALPKILALAIFGVSVVGLCAPAMADTPWQKVHPRREEVNGRLAHQDARIHHDVRDGQLNHRQARVLHEEDRHIRHEERDMASLDHGHITHRDQFALNAQENAVSRQIGR